MRSFTVQPWNETGKSWIVVTADGRTAGSVKSSKEAAQQYADSLEEEWNFRREQLLQRNKKNKSMWTKNDALNFIDALYSELYSAGYKAEITGSVKTKGKSNNDLDIRLTPIRPDFSDEPLFEFFRQRNWVFDYLGYSKTENVLNVVLSDGRVVDFFGGQYSKR